MPEEEPMKEIAVERNPNPSLREESIRPMAKPQQLLDIAKEVQEFIDSKNWSWCDMERVYRILKTVNG